MAPNACYQIVYAIRALFSNKVKDVAILSSAFVIYTAVCFGVYFIYPLHFKIALLFLKLQWMDIIYFFKKALSNVARFVCNKVVK